MGRADWPGDIVAGRPARPATVSVQSLDAAYLAQAQAFIQSGTGALDPRLASGEEGFRHWLSAMQLAALRRQAARKVLGFYDTWRKNAAVIPARGGSKGLPGKNIRPLGGLPLIVHSIRLAPCARK